MVAKTISSVAPSTSAASATAHVSGGSLTHVDTSSFARASAYLSDAERNARLTASLIAALSNRLYAARHAMQTLAANSTNSANEPPADAQHLCESIDSATLLCQTLAEDSSQAADHLADLSDNVARAGNLYSTAETSLLTLFSQAGWGAVTQQAAPFGGAALIGGAFALTANGNSVGARILRSTDGNQEEWFRQFACCINPTGLFSANAVNRAATALTPFAKIYMRFTQGPTLHVSRYQPTRDRLSSAHTVADGLRNLDTLASDSSVPYSTVAVQKYQDNDGTVRWIVYVPGTNEHKDSPMGWGQNIELMSSDNNVRMSASSIKLTEEAMRRSGIRPNDPIVLVGHSQGGLVAASIASSEKYNVTHVVTAGSPIANHPIPESTWVTSIETQGELVSKLDGASNPQRRTWTTVSGTISSSASSPSVPAPSGNRKGASGRATNSTPVAGAPADDELTHGMNYHRATWKNAKMLHNQSVDDSDEHFREQTRGKLVSTQYYTGRMKNDDNSER